MNTSEFFIGLMSGTSLDSIDAVLVNFPQGKPKLVGSLSSELPNHIRKQILQLNSSGDHEIEVLADLDPLLGKLFANSCLALLDKFSIDPSVVCAIGSHGQTIRHRPHKGYTLQIGDPNVIAELTGITTVADFRRRDLAAGGQGAPLVPAFHYQCFHSCVRNRVIVNIGGMANITLLPASLDEVVVGYDTGPGNVLLDSWIAQQRGLSYDADGDWAASGSIHTALLEQFMSEPYFNEPFPKSTGRELFNAKWIQQQLAQTLSDNHQKLMTDADIQATLTEVTAKSITHAILSHSLTEPEIYICGGGSHNKFLLDRLSLHLNTQVQSTEVLGLHPDWVEACAFAWLAYRTLNHQSGNLAAVTGAKGERILGGIYLA